MSGPGLAALPSSGLDEGRPEALRGLVDARGPSVLAYCIEICGDERGARVAGESLARFRAALSVVGAPTAVGADILLLAATRHAAAELCDVDWLRRNARSQSRDGACEKVPTLIAARARGQLGGADIERLARHFERCEGCRLAEAAFSRAERAYRDPQLELTPAEQAIMLIALEAVDARQDLEDPAATAEWAVVEESPLPPGHPEPPIAPPPVAPPQEPPLEPPVLPPERPPLQPPVQPPSIDPPPVLPPLDPPSAPPEPPRPIDPSRYERDEPMPVMPRRARATTSTIEPPPAPGGTRGRVRPRRWMLALSVLLIGGAGAALAGGVLDTGDDTLTVQAPSLATAPPRPVTTKLPIQVSTTTTPGATQPAATPTATAPVSPSP